MIDAMPHNAKYAHISRMGSYGAERRAASIALRHGVAWCWSSVPHPDTLCDHVSNLWCALPDHAVPATPARPSMPSHSGLEHQSTHTLLLLANSAVKRHELCTRQASSRIDEQAGVLLPGLCPAVCSSLLSDMSYMSPGLGHAVMVMTSHDCLNLNLTMRQPAGGLGRKHLSWMVLTCLQHSAWYRPGQGQHAHACVPLF